VSAAQQKERDYCLLREGSIPQLRFIQPLYEGMVYDFIVEGKRVQEKVAQTHRNAFSCLFHKHAGRNKSQNYIKGDNDYYWINLPDEKHFYVIPEYEMLKHDLISYSPRLGKKGMCLYPFETGKKHSWTNSYLFNYTNPDVSKLKQLLATDYTDIEEQEMFVKMVEFWNV
jgi:hypothetical protein